MPVKKHQSEAPAPTEAEAREAVTKILESERISRRSKTLLRFLAEHTLSGDEKLLHSPKTIADILLRPASAPDVDLAENLIYRDERRPEESDEEYVDRISSNRDTQLRGVKMQLRENLQRYRHMEGREERVEVDMGEEKGSFKITFRYKDTGQLSPSRDNVDPEDLLLKLHRLNKRARWLEKKVLKNKFREIGDRIEDILDDATLKHVTYSPILIDSINTLGRVAANFGKYDLAEFHIKWAMELCLTQDHGDESLEFADSLEVMARLAGRRKEWGDVRIFLQRCTEIRETKLGKQHLKSVKARRDYDLFMFILKDPRVDGGDTDQWASEDEQ